MEKLIIDVLIPTNNLECIVSLLEALQNQKDISINKIVLPVTLSNNELKTSFINEFHKYNNIIYYFLEPKDFSHSLTREKAIKEYCESNTVVLLSQDIKLIDERAIYKLAFNVANNKCAYSFGRQVCPKNSIEKYIRDRNYQDQSRFISKNDVDKLQIMTFFTSDAFSCLNREVFIRIGGYQGFDLPTNEDIFYSYHLIMKGYTKYYCAEAVVEHYHNYTLKDLYKRYYITGQFFSQVKVFDEYKNNTTGLSLAFQVLGKAFKHFDVKSIIMWIPNMATRYIAFKKGRHHEK